jgi:processive 1,2-diacylglycerol beta-glucosyltransferase
MTGLAHPLIVVLYACSGSRGHQVLAENYCDLLRSAGINAVAVDVLALDSRRRFSGYTASYLWILRRLPWLWRWLYHNWRKVPGIDRWRQQILPRRFRRTQDLLKTLKPALVISTHPIATATADYLKRRGKLKTPLWVAVSDWHIQPFWLFSSVDCYLVPTHTQKLDIERISPLGSEIIVIGMLLRKMYYEPMNQQAARAHLKVPVDARIIVVMGGGSGWKLEKILKELTKLEARLVVLAGSTERQMQVQSYLRRHACGKSVEVLGFVDPLPYIVAADLVITKPGGLSTAEVLYLRKPLILVEPMPGHEEENRRVLSALGVCVASTSEELLHLAKTVLDNRNIAGGTTLTIESICRDATPQLALDNICNTLKIMPEAKGFTYKVRA